MELKDFLFTPVYLLLVYFIAYTTRSRFSNSLTAPYFIPALSVKIIGAICLGLVYQFYYKGGDTFNYFDQSNVIHQAFANNLFTGLKLLLANGNFEPSTFEYTTQIYWYNSPSEYFVIKMTALFGLFCDNSYSTIAIFFAIFSFSGLWATFSTLVRVAPGQSRILAWCILFVPSVFFWGSGLMKDTIALGALGWLFYGFHRGLILKEAVPKTIVIILISSYIIYQVKIYILLSFLPPAVLWVFLETGKSFRSSASSWVIKPLLLIVGISFAYLAATTVTEGDAKYDLDNIGRRTKINADYLYRISLAQQGSAYYLGDLDGSLESMIRHSPDAVIVTLFRPFLWEVNNPLMLLAAVESLIFTVFLISLFARPGVLNSVRALIKVPIISFCFIFCLIFSVAVGLNSFNFGTLVRYKIQLLPFYLTGIALIKYYCKQAQGRIAIKNVAYSELVESHTIP